MATSICPVYRLIEIRRKVKSLAKIGEELSCLCVGPCTQDVLCRVSVGAMVENQWWIIYPGHQFKPLLSREFVEATMINLLFIISRRSFFVVL
jgi:hypothetical protein